jgi:hypothetical protein
MFVKLIAKPDTWFKAGTEVLWEDNKWVDRRPTEQEWEEIVQQGFSVFRGIRVAEDNPNENARYTPGEEYEDGEVCQIGRAHV